MYLFKLNLKYMFNLLLCGVFPLIAFGNPNCDNTYKDIWRLYKQDNIYEVKNNLQKCSFSDGYISDVINILKSDMFYEEGQYEESLMQVKKSRKRIEFLFHKNNLKINNDQYTKELNYFYYFMVTTQANTYFMLGKYKDSLENYNILLKSDEKIYASTYIYAAFCHYYLNEYDMAIKRFKETYNVSADDTLKMKSAYNIAAIYAKKEKIDKSVKWVEIGLNHHLQLSKKSYLNKVRLDQDFKNVKNTSEYKKFFDTIK